jgi:hypothetical protein
MGLLQFGFGILGARGPTAMRVGIGGERGLQGYRDAIEDTWRDKCTNSSTITVRTTSTGFLYDAPGGLTPEEAAAITVWVKRQRGR